MPEQRRALGPKRRPPAGLAADVAAGVGAMKLRLLRGSFALGSWLLPGVTLRSAQRLFETPASSSRQRMWTDVPHGPEVRFLPWRGERLALYQWGDPAREPTVLLAHGWSSSGQRFGAWLPALRDAGYAVVAFDQLGHGRSSGRRNHLAGFVDTMVAVAAQVRTGAGAGGHGTAALAGVIGHSLGGAAVALALSRGLRAHRAVLVAPPADVAATGHRFARRIGLAGHLVDPLLARFAAHGSVEPEWLHAHLHVAALSAQALVIHDFADQEVPWEEGERYARYWPGARMLGTAGLGHRRILDDPGIIDAALRFLAGAPVGERVVSTRELPFGLA